MSSFAIGGIASGLSKAISNILAINQSLYRQALSILASGDLPSEQKRKIIEAMPNFMGKQRVLSAIPEPTPPPDIEGYTRQVALTTAGIKETPFNLAIQQFEQPELSTPQQQLQQALDISTGLQGVGETPTPQPLPQYKFISGESLSQLAPREKTLLQSLLLSRAPLYGLKPSAIKDVFLTPAEITQKISQTAGKYTTQQQQAQFERLGGEPQPISFEQKLTEEQIKQTGENPLIKGIEKRIYNLAGRINKTLDTLGINTDLITAILANREDAVGTFIDNVMGGKTDSFILNSNLNLSQLESIDKDLRKLSPEIREQIKLTTPSVFAFKSLYGDIMSNTLLPIATYNIISDPEKRNKYAKLDTAGKISMIEDEMRKISRSKKYMENIHRKFVLAFKGDNIEQNDKIKAAYEISSKIYNRIINEPDFWDYMKYFKNYIRFAGAQVFDLYRQGKVTPSSKLLE